MPRTQPPMAATQAVPPVDAGNPLLRPGPWSMLPSLANTEQGVVLAVITVRTATTTLTVMTPDPKFLAARGLELVQLAERMDSGRQTASRLIVPGIQDTAKINKEKGGNGG